MVKMRALGALGILVGVVLLAQHVPFAGWQTLAAPNAAADEQSNTRAAVLSGGGKSPQTGTTGAAQSRRVAATPDAVAGAVTADRAVAASAVIPNRDELRGKIIFFSDRGGSYPALYRMNPDGSDQRLCYCEPLFADIFFRETASPSGAQFLFIKSDDHPLAGSIDTQVWMHDTISGRDTLVSGAYPGFPGVDYDPVWSPDGKHVAWATEAHIFAEIYLYDFKTDDNTLLTESHGEWNKHPSFSPDGSQLVFWRNAADADIRQIWLTNLDGTHQQNLSRNAWRDWDPIWVK